MSRHKQAKLILDRLKYKKFTQKWKGYTTSFFLSKQGKRLVQL